MKRERKTKVGRERVVVKLNECVECDSSLLPLPYTCRSLTDPSSSSQHLSLLPQSPPASPSTCLFLPVPSSPSQYLSLSSPVPIYLSLIASSPFPSSSTDHFASVMPSFVIFLRKTKTSGYDHDSIISPSLYSAELLHWILPRTGSPWNSLPRCIFPPKFNPQHFTGPNVVVVMIMRME